MTVHALKCRIDSRRRPCPGPDAICAVSDQWSQRRQSTRRITAAVSVPASSLVYTAAGDDLLHATLALARQPVKAGFDPVTL